MSDNRYSRPYPFGAQGRLQELVNAVCPSHGISFPSLDDNASWVLNETDDATPDQIAAAHAIMAAFDPWADIALSRVDLPYDAMVDGANTLPEIRTAYEDSHDAPEQAEAGTSEPADDGAGGDLGQEALGDVADDVAAGDAVDGAGVDPANSGGVLIRELGDALTTAKAIALMAVDDERFQRVGDYDKGANQTRLDELRAIQQAIREGVHPAFTDEQTEELQALETFLPFMQRIDDHAQGLRNAIREAGDLEVLTSIDIQSGWPE